MTQQNLVSAAIAAFMAAALLAYPEILKDQTTAVVSMLGFYIVGLFRPQPHKTEDAAPAANQTKPPAGPPVG